MNFSQLKDRAAAVAHRADLTAQMDNFVADATESINIRFGLQLPILTQPTDTNAMLESYPQLYLQGTLKSLYEYLNNGDNAKYYGLLFSQGMDQMNITAETVATDPAYSVDPPTITNTGG